MRYAHLEGKKYVNLVRCSSDQQADTSPVDQQNVLNEFAKYNGMIHAGTDVVLEGVSGSLPGARVDIDEVISRKVARDDFSVLLVQDLSRFTRGGIDHTGHLKWELAAAGVEVVFVSMGTTGDVDTDSLVQSAGAYAAQQQAKSMSFAVIEYDPPLPEQTYDQYLAGLGDVIRESLRISRVGGRLAIVLDTVANREGGRHAMWPVIADVTKLAIACGWDFWTDLAWCKDEVSGKKTNFGSLALCSSPDFGRNHEWILLFYKEKKKLAGDKTLCDLSRSDHLAWWTSTWNIPPETRKDIRTEHPAPFPEKLVERLIKLLTYRRDLVVDPFNGSGTTTVVAARLGRRYVGVDRSSKYCILARLRTNIPASKEDLRDHKELCAAL